MISCNILLELSLIQWPWGGLSVSSVVGKGSLAGGLKPRRGLPETERLIRVSCLIALGDWYKWW